MSEGHAKSFEHIDRVLAAVDVMREAVTHHETAWHWKKLREYAGALFDRGPFKPGDRVRLTKTPVINEKKSWGWMGCRHFLVAGALGTVKYVDFGDGHFNAHVQWDDESWITDGGPDKGKVNMKVPEERSLFMHWETSLERVPSHAQTNGGPESR